MAHRTSSSDDEASMLQATCADLFAHLEQFVQFVIKPLVIMLLLLIASGIC